MKKNFRQRRAAAVTRLRDPAERDDLVLKPPPVTYDFEPSFGMTVVRLEEIEMTAGGVIVPEMSKGVGRDQEGAPVPKKMVRMIVVKSHPLYYPPGSDGHAAEPTPFKPGDQVLAAGQVPFSRAFDQHENEHVFATIAFVGVVKRPPTKVVDDVS